MASIIQMRRDHLAAWASENPILAEGEISWVIDTNRMKIGNGIDDWLSLPYFGETGGSSYFIPPISFTWGDPTQAIFTAPEDGVITIVRLQYLTAFNGSGTQIAIGVGIGDDSILPANWNNPYSTMEFENSPDRSISAGQQVWLNKVNGSATQGSGIIFLNFVPSN